MWAKHLFVGLDQSVALDETGTRIADFELLDMIDAEEQKFQVHRNSQDFTKELVFIGMYISCI